MTGSSWIAKDLWNEMATMTETNIVKSLEKEFDMIDYSQWERTDRHGRSRSAQTSSLPPIKWSPEALGNHWTIVKKDKEKTAHRATQQQNKSEGIFRLSTDLSNSNKCNHPWHKRIVLREDDPCYVEMQNKIAILKKGISGVHEWKRQEIEAAKNDLNDTEEKVGQRSGVLHRQLEEVNTRIRNAQGELSMLKDFRDKEYPIYALRIAELQREIGNLPQIHQAELDDVKQLTLVEKKKLEGALMEKEQEILQKIAEEQFRSIPPGLQELMFHNTVMKKEIEVHKELNKNMERNNLALQQKLLHLLKAKRDCREEIFADILKKQPKCTPDMDVVLNIPREECLPI
ncbi:uncharacterized protein C20orf96 homolog isoform X4 [Heterodontus francisci]|uniref:uncharacterized protein C20orf96 homolog isoform X4 n=1 Tax=Heterodontus francisci TaxID=7792 RepID=UPI00355B48AF